MTDEIKVTEEKECNCFCKSKGFRKFLITALGTFVGVYAALSLFAALHRPPMMPPCPMGFGQPAPFAAHCPFKKQPHFDKHNRGHHGDFHKMIKGNSKAAPFEANRDRED